MKEKKENKTASGYYNNSIKWLFLSFIIIIIGIIDSLSDSLNGLYISRISIWLFIGSLLFTYSSWSLVFWKITEVVLREIKNK